MNRTTLPDEVVEETDSEDLVDVTPDDISETPITVLHDRYPTGAWYVVEDDELLKRGSKVGGGWKTEAFAYARGHADRLRR